MACLVGRCAANAECIPIGSSTFYCRCNDGFDGDGYTNCKMKPFKEFTIMLVLTCVFFCILLALLIYMVCRGRQLKTKGSAKAYDPYNINWNAYMKEWKNTATVRGKEKSRKPLDQNGHEFIVETDIDKAFPTFKTDDPTVQEQRENRSPSRSNSIRINITDEDVVEQDTQDVKGESGVDNPVYEEAQPLDSSQKNISLTTFKAVEETQSGASQLEVEQKPPPYSSKHSFKESRKSPRVKPKIVLKKTDDESKDVE